MHDVPLSPQRNWSSSLVLVLAHDPQHKVDDDGAEQGNGQDGGSEAVVEAALAALADALGAPVEGHQCVGHGGHGNEGEEAGGDLANLVAKVEQADGEAAEDDGEVEPGEEGSLVGEEDLGLDAGGEGDALAWASVREGEALGGGGKYPARSGGEAGWTWRRGAEVRFAGCGMRDAAAVTTRRWSD